MSTNVRRDQERIAQQSAVAEMLGGIYRILGTDARGYEVRHYFVDDEVQIVDPETKDVVDATKLDGRTPQQYRDWVDEYVDATEVDWNEEAF